MRIMTVADGTPERRRQRAALVAVALGVFCVQLDAFALNVALPRIGRDLSASPGGTRWVLSAYLLAAGSLMPAGGRMGDLLGRRRSLAAGLALFGAASLACALAPSLPALVAARVAQGAGGALIMPVGLALLTNAFPPGHRERATGYALGFAGVATVCGPFVGGFLSEVLSWRAVFWLNVPPAALALLLVRRAGESRDTTAAAPDPSALVTGTAALAALAALLDRLPAGGPWSAASGALLGAVVLLAVLFAARERRAAQPLLEPELFRNGPYVALTAAGAVANAATVVLLFVVPLSLQGARGLSAGTAGAVLLVPAAAMAAGGPLAGRVRSPRTVPAMAVCLGAGAALLYAAGWAAAPLPVHLLAVTGCGAALGMANALTLIATQAVVRPERAGAASGVTKTAVTLAAGLAVAATGPATAPRGDQARSAVAEGALTTAGAGCLAACLLLALWLRHRRRTAP